MQTRLGSGVSLASYLDHAENRIELGAGGFAELGSDDGPRPEPSELGVYADAGYAVVNTGHARVFAGMRGEKYWRGDTDWAGKARLDLELVARSPTNLTSEKYFSRGRAAGNAAIGFYLEAGRAALAEQNAWVASGGLTMRLPAFAFMLRGEGGRRGGTWSPSLSGWRGRN